MNSGKTVGLVMGDLSNPYGRVVLETLREVLLPEGYSVIAYSLHDGGTLESKIEELLALGDFAGLVAGVASSLDSDSAIDKLSFEYHRRVVLIGAEHPLVDSVSADFEEGGYLATKHLIELGHREIAFVGAQLTDARRLTRLRGYMSALQHFGLPVRPDLVIAGAESSSGGFGTAQAGSLAARQAMRLRNPPTAIFARNDHVALGALKALKTIGKRVPGDVSLVGFDGIDEGATSNPPLTTIVQPTVTQVRVAAEYLLHRIASEDSRLPPRRTVMSCRLIRRGSTAQSSNRRL